MQITKRSATLRILLLNLAYEMRIGLTKDAEKQFKKLPKTAQIIATRRIRQLSSEQYIQTERLTGYKELFRTRVGQYRIVYRKFSNKIVVVLISHRREVYKLVRKLLK